MVPAPRTPKQQMASAYQGVIEAVLAVVFCALGGHWLDGRFGTAPLGILGGIGLGFAAFMVRMWRLRSLMGGPASETPGEANDEKGPPEST